MCEGFDFDPTSLANEVGGWYEPDIKEHHKHNMVFSVENGLLLYVDKNKKSWMYPPTAQLPAKNRFISALPQDKTHFYMFSTYMNTATTSATILFPEMTAYMPALNGGAKYDES